MATNSTLIVGAGASGIAALRAFTRRDLPAVCYEAGSQPGGLWRYRNDNGMSNIYGSLHTNTSRGRTGYPDHPMPDSLPDFPHHTDMLAYLEDYVDRFDLGEHIRTNHRVAHIARAGVGEEGGYRVTTRKPDGSEVDEVFSTVVVCNGHHWDPYMPDLPGEFSGEVLHSSEYKDAERYAGRRVLVVGMGNSACDIACDLAKSGDVDVTLSARSGAHVIGKHILGRPIDLWTNDFISRLPISVQRALFSLLVWVDRGTLRRNGLPKPTHRFLTAHPTISTEFLDLVRGGTIEVRGAFDRVSGRDIHFIDGQRWIDDQPFDVIILATGYSVSFPFFDDDFVTVQDNALSLYNHVVHPNHPDLYFVGLIQPLGALPPLAYEQAEWVASLVDGTSTLPAKEEMNRTISDERTLTRKRFIPTRRHTMEVEFFEYRRRLRKARG